MRETKQLDQHVHMEGLSHLRFHNSKICTNISKQQVNIRTVFSRAGSWARTPPRATFATYYVSRQQPQPLPYGGRLGRPHPRGAGARPRTGSHDAGVCGVGWGVQACTCLCVCGGRCMCDAFALQPSAPGRSYATPQHTFDERKSAKSDE